MGTLVLPRLPEFKSTEPIFVIIWVLTSNMDYKVALSCTVLCTLMDVVVTTLLYTQGWNLSIFKEDALNFNILESALDLWGIVVLRASFLLGALIGLSWNREDGPQRVAKLTSFIIFICLIIFTYTLTKLLILTEPEPLTHQPWLLSLICWTSATTVGFLLLWRLLGTVSKPGSHNRGSIAGGRGSEDTEKLVDVIGGDEQKLGSQKKEKTSSGATLGRLLAYCKKDSGLLFVAVLFLIISAVCECPRYSNISQSNYAFKSHWTEVQHLCIECQFCRFFAMAIFEHVGNCFTHFISHNTLSFALIKSILAQHSTQVARLIAPYCRCSAFTNAVFFNTYYILTNMEPKDNTPKK